MGQGPLTGRGMGFCVVKLSEAKDGSASGDEVVTHLNRKEVSTMPAGNGTGPAGMGPMTGRAAGYCAGYAMPGFMNPMAGRAVAGAYAQPYTATPYAAAPYSPQAAGFGYAPRGFYGAFPRRVWGWARGVGRGFGRGFGRGRW